MEDAKVYGLCLGRLKHQIGVAKKKTSGGGGRILLESYCFSDPEDIVDILELYDIGDRSLGALMEKLDDLAYTASVLMRESLRFGIDENGIFGLYLLVDEASSGVSTPEHVGAYASSMA